MKKKITIIVAIALIISCAVALVACADRNLKVGKEYVEADSQVRILTELKAKTSDIGVMDSIMAGYYMTMDSNSDLQIIKDCILADEYYGIGARKGSGIINAINQALVDLKKAGDIDAISEKYGLTDDIDIDTDKTYDIATDNDDYKYITEKGKLIIGYTVFAPIAYPNEDNNLIGFDIELARKVAEKLGLDVEFQEIVWATKETELSAKTIDLIWNGMTITDERKESMEMSAPYMQNKQVAVIRKDDADKFTKDTETWKEATMIAESGSAGESCIVIK